LRYLFFIFFAGMPKYTPHGSVDLVTMLDEPMEEPSPNVTPENNTSCAYDCMTADFNSAS
jgi:hypothetical protein